MLAVHHPGVDNALADSLSREAADSKEWSLDQQVANRLFQIWGCPFLYLFAMSKNNKLPLFFSRVPERGSLVEAFSRESQRGALWWRPLASTGVPGRLTRFPLSP
jgi:hypothetical protein